MENASEIRVNVSADLVARASICRSDETTRYYLSGVYVEPAKAGGVMIVAANGHVLACLHDKEGFASRGVIINPDKAMLAWAKKAPKAAAKTRKWQGLSVGQPPSITNGHPKRIIMRDGELFGTRQSYVLEDMVLDMRTVEARQWREVWIDGTFPDYRRTIPKVGPLIPAMGPAYNGAYVADMARVLCSKVSGAVSIMQPATAGKATPAFVFAQNPDVDGFCLLMPMRGSGSIPAFWKTEMEPIAAEAT